MISLFDALAISGLHLTMAFSVGVSITSVYVLPPSVGAFLAFPVGYFTFPKSLLEDPFLKTPA